MDTACLDYCLTHEERLLFDKNGFFVVEDALPPKLVDDLNAVLDQLEAKTFDPSKIYLPTNA